MLFEKPAKKVAREIVRERWREVIRSVPELRKYENEIHKLYSVEPDLHSEYLEKALAEILTAPEAETSRITKKYVLRRDEIRVLRSLRPEHIEDVHRSVRKAVNLAEKHRTLRTFAAREELKGVSGEVRGILRGRVRTTAEDYAIYHELAHALEIAYIMKTRGLNPIIARLLGAIGVILPAEDREAFAFALSHHLMGHSPDPAFFRRIRRNYSQLHADWNHERFEKRYREYREILEKKGIDAALRYHWAGKT